MLKAEVVDLPDSIGVVAQPTKISSGDGARVVVDVVTPAQASGSRNPTLDGRIVANHHVSRRIDQGIEASVVAVLDDQITVDDQDQIARIAICIDPGVVVDEQVALDINPRRPRRWRNQVPVGSGVPAQPVTVAGEHRARVACDQHGVGIETRQHQWRDVLVQAITDRPYLATQNCPGCRAEHAQQHAQRHNKHTARPLHTHLSTVTSNRRQA
ncbi:hypothetical protein D3C84_593870 [compost metagenome]